MPSNPIEGEPPRIGCGAWLFRLPGRFTRHARKTCLQFKRDEPLRGMLLLALRRIAPLGAPPLPATGRRLEPSVGSGGELCLGTSSTGSGSAPHPDAAAGDRDGEECTGPDWVLANSMNYSYDLVGNRTDSGAQVETGNRLTAFDGYSLKWDSAGHLVSKTGNGLDQDFFWNATGRLDSVTTDGVTTRYVYDGFGRRIEVSEPGPGGTREYVYDGRDVFLELEGSGLVLAAYTQYPGVDRPHSVRRGSSTYYYVRDQVGSVLGLFDGNGNVENEYRYRPFGQPEVVSEGVDNPYLFTGRAWDAGPELYYYRARYYDPDLARFISEDPMGLAAGVNPYVYAGNSPLNATDPFGLDDCDLEAAAGDRGDACRVGDVGTTVDHPFSGLKITGAGPLSEHGDRAFPYGPPPDPEEETGSPNRPSAICDDLSAASTKAYFGSLISAASWGSLGYKMVAKGTYDAALKKWGDGYVRCNAKAPKALG